MLFYNRWQSTTALLMLLGMTSVAAVPIIVSAPAMAGEEPYVVGQRSRSSRVILPAGTIIPVRYDKAEKIIVAPKETVPVTLTVAEDIRSSSERIVIPAGSQIKGKLQPAEGGTQFVAQELILSRRQRLPIEATSEVITTTETINKRTGPDILRGAVIGAVAGAVISEILGDVDLGEVLAGAGIGVGAEVLRGRKEKEVEVVVVDPDTDLDLTLEEDLVRSRRY
jgi:hypothetical protein